MSKPDPTIEWHTVESDAEWERLSLPRLPDDRLATVPTSRAKSLTKQVIWGALVMFLLCVGTGVWWRYTAQLRSQQSEMELRTMLQQKFKEFAPDDAHVVLQTLMLQDRLATAQVITEAKNGAAVYRQTRFYRQTATGWQPTAPNTALWGPEHSLETPLFIFHFRQYDTATVIAVAPQVDALYTTLLHNVGLPIPANAAPSVIEVSVTEPPGILTWRRMPTALRVPSPAVYWAPREITDAELLLQSIALPLSAYVLQQAREHYTVRSAWQPLLNGLHLWQLWELDLPLAVWREDIVRWLYLDVPTTRAEKGVILPKHYEAFCTMHQLWMQSPLLLNIPLVCTKLDWENQFLSPWVLQDALRRLDQIAMPTAADEYISPSATSAVFHPGQTVALATLIEYTVTIYGRERLPTLLAGLGQYESWYTLIPAVYGVSPTTFEVGWQTFLMQYYDIGE